MLRRVSISCTGLLLIAAAILAVGTGCANIVPPSGGFRDSLPPVLVKASPADSSRHFNGNRITLTFDEYVNLDNFTQNVVISPVPKNIPAGTFKLNTVSIRLKDSLEPNTTYSINFGNSIKDYNEGNVMKNFTYVFSTGARIDSLSFSGNVLVAETGAPDSTLIVMLHTRPDDSAVVKARPRYYAKIDGKGNFIFHNLPPGVFYVYAMKDDTRSFQYRDPRTLFAFADSPVVVSSNTPKVSLYAYQATKPTGTGGAAVAGGGTAADKRLKFQTSVRSGAQDLLQNFSFRFDRPLRRFDSAKVRVCTDSTFKSVSGYSWSIDSTKKTATLNMGWQENTLYHLIVAKDFATDTMGYQLLKTDTISFISMKSSDYGKLSIRFRNVDKYHNPVLQFVQQNETVRSFPLTGPDFSQNLFLPGEYEIRILNDENKNGVWDPGEFFGKHRQPEIVKPIDRKITVKQNWENEFEIAL